VFGGVRQVRVELRDGTGTFSIAPASQDDDVTCDYEDDDDGMLVAVFVHTYNHKTLLK